MLVSIVVALPALAQEAAPSRLDAVQKSGNAWLSLSCRPAADADAKKKPASNDYKPSNTVERVVLYGVNDLVVVAQDGLTLVTTVDRSADLKKLVESLPPRFRKRT